MGGGISSAIGKTLPTFLFLLYLLFLVQGCQAFPSLSIQVNTTVQSTTSVAHQINFNVKGLAVSLLKPYEVEIRDLIRAVESEGWEVQRLELTESAYNIQLRKAFGSAITLDLFSHHLETKDIGVERQFDLVITIPKASFQLEFEKVIDSLLPIAEKMPLKAVTWTVNMPGRVIETNNANSVKDHQTTWRLNITDLVNGKELRVSSLSAIASAALAEKPPLTRISAATLAAIITSVIALAGIVLLLFKFVPPWVEKRRLERTKVPQDYEQKLAQWEKEGYDVEELRKKWFKSQK